MNRFSALDGLRGVAALSIALYHLPIAMSVYASPFIRHAAFAVDFFFVLSGFVIAHAYADRLTSVESVRSFVVRRIGRLWPLHIVVLLAMLAVELGRLAFVSQLGGDIRPPFSGETSLEALFANLFLVHAWGQPASWNIPSWSISAELFAYLAFAGVCLLAPRHARLAATTIVLASAAALIVFHTDHAVIERLDILRACCGFFAGTLAYAAFARNGRPAWSVLPATLIELAVLASALMLIAGIAASSGPEILATPILALAVYVFAAERGYLSRLLATPPLQFLGAISYSVYLTHGLVITAFTAGGRTIGKLLGESFRTPSQLLYGEGDAMLVDFGRFWVNDLYALAFVATVIVLSAITYRFVELPGQRRFANLAKPALRLRAS